MVWMLMPGQTWAGAAAAFDFMWVGMMIPMMMPSLAPALWRHRKAVVAGAGYFFVWALLGLAVYPLGVLLAHLTVSWAASAAVVGAGLVQFSAWKQRQLACCHALAKRGAGQPAAAATAWLHGMHLGARCALACGNLMAILLVAGVMNTAAMMALTAAITLERVLPGGGRVARWTGVVIVGAGLFLLVGATTSPTAAV
jgi:predicted metal-binding membrane protein